MSTFFENWEQCMTGKGFPVPTVENAREAIEFLHVLQSALENAGGDAEVTIGTLIASGALGGVGEGTLVVLAGVAQTAVLVYVHVGISCLANVATGSLKELFAENELPDFVVAELESQGIGLTEEAIA